MPKLPCSKNQEGTRQKVVMSRNIFPLYVFFVSLLPSFFYKISNKIQGNMPDGMCRSLIPLIVDKNEIFWDLAFLYNISKSSLFKRKPLFLI
jgi:hypothetical protein